MKLAVVQYPGSINIGDEVQSIAVERLLPQVDHYVARERMNQFKSDEIVKLICNGWFMIEPQNWPPSPDLEVLFISFHITTSNKSAKLLADPKLKSYYKQFEPIGCRDMGTLRLFQKMGVEAYFSNCITLTLENPYPIEERGDKILIVDPFRHNYTKKYRDYFTERIVPEQYRDQVEVIYQRGSAEGSREERFQIAEELLDKYAKAKLVITSRIHCALPCLAMGVPVYFVNAGYGSLFSFGTLGDRFEGIIDQFRVIEEDTFPYSASTLKDEIARRLGLYKGKEIKPLDINWENPEPNPVDITPVAKQLRETVRKFISNNSEE
jgi:hypothetical protein